MKIVELGGAQELLNMLGAAKDDRTRKEALKALAALFPSGYTFISLCTHTHTHTFVLNLASPLGRLN